MPEHYLIDLNENRVLPSIGNKARNLRALMDRGFPVPHAYVLTWEAYQEYLRDNTAIVPLIKQELSRFIRPGQLYAVRSSANVEDSLLSSFAGQFKSVLNVCEPDAVFQSIWAIWATASSDNVRVYLDKSPSGQSELKMAVIIQEMAAPVISGVAFSRNPINGLDEVVVEAVRGSGQALVQEGSTPDRWIYKWGQWLIRPENTPIPEEVILKVVQQVQKVCTAFRRDIDLEWVYDGHQIFLVQMRDITSIGKVDVYSNALSKDMLPGAIKPLIWSVNIPIMAGQILLFLSEMIGSTDFKPDDLIRPFYYRAYLNITTLGKIFSRIGLPGESLEMMMGIGPGGAQMPKVKMHRKMLKLLPRLAKVMWEKLRFARRLDHEIPQIQAESRTFLTENAETLTTSELLAETRRVFDLARRTAYLHFVSQILMYIYTGILRGQFKKRGLDFEQLDLMDGLPEMEKIDPTIQLQHLADMFNRLPEAVRAQVCASTYAEFTTLPDLKPFQQAVAAYLHHFGHLSNSGNDFSNAPWRETPDLILQTITCYQKRDNQPAGIKVTFEQLPLRGLSRLLVRTFYRRARQFRLYREQIGLLYTYVYGLFRVYYLALAGHFVRLGLLSDREDIFFLSSAEVWSLVETPRDWRPEVAQRREEMDRMGAVPLPSIVYGDQAPPVLNLSDRRLTGTPTSRGCFTGPVRVVRGIQDFTKVRSGDVLVVPFSDVGWAPLFARAGGVVAESGGMLSHSSIIAREYNIPAVVSVVGALQLADDTLVTVDGFAGDILIHNTGAVDDRF